MNSTDYIRRVYQDIVIPSIHHEYELQQIANYADKDVSSLLDVGCMHGYLGYALKDQAPHIDVVGIDLVNNLRYSSDYLAFSEANATERGIFKDDEFDVVVASRMLHENEDQDMIANNCFKWARRQVVFLCVYGGVCEVELAPVNEAPWGVVETIGFFYPAVEHKQKLIEIAKQYAYGLRYQVSMRKGAIMYVFENGYYGGTEINTFNWGPDTQAVEMEEIVNLTPYPYRSKAVLRTVVSEPKWS